MLAARMLYDGASEVNGTFHDLAWDAMAIKDHIHMHTWHQFHAVYTLRYKHGSNEHHRLSESLACVC